MKPNTVYKRAFNECLSLLAACPLGQWPGSELQLSARLKVSRTTVRAVLTALADKGIVRGSGSQRRLMRHPAQGDYFPDTQTETVAELVDRKFMRWVLQGDYRPGQTVNTLELARQFGVSTTAVREYLTHFSRFGLIRRQTNSGWVFAGVTAEFAKEICDVRELFELRSARRFVELPAHAPAWAELDDVEQEHHRLLRELDDRYSDFSSLDERLHRLIHEALPNRFIREFDDVISFIFHYHYQWDKSDEKERNRIALNEHLAYIAALRSRNPERVDESCRVHLGTARATLLRSINLAPHRETRIPA